MAPTLAITPARPPVPTAPAPKSQSRHPGAPAIGHAPSPNRRRPSSRCSDPLLLCGLLEDVHAAGGAEADHMRKAHRGPLDLAVARLAPQVVADLPDVGDASGRDRVTLGLQAARHVDGCRAVAPGGARLE